MKLAFKPVSAVYRIAGPDLKAALEAAGKSQADLVRACGYRSPTIVSRIVNAPAYEMSSASVKAFRGGLAALGIACEGLIDSIEGGAPEGPAAGSTGHA